MPATYGGAGRLIIERVGVSVPLYDKGTRKSGQDVVDRENSALLSRQYRCHYIADHAAQEFDRIKRLVPGDYAVIQTPKSTQFYICVAVTLGTNTGHDLIAVDGAKVSTCRWADLCTYCCNDDKGTSITMVFWTKGLYLPYTVYTLE